MIDLPSIAHGEFHENCDRQNYSPSELVAIVDSLRDFGHGGDRRSDQGRIRDNDRLTVAQAADRVGWKKDTYFRAKKVTENGVPDLIEMMDTGKISVFQASVIAAEPAQDQEAVLARNLTESKLAGSVRKQLRRVRTDASRQERINGSIRLPNAEDTIRTYHCPFQELEAKAGIEPESVQLICTDIPYGDDFVSQVEGLASFAERVLVPGGLFVAYLGQHRLDEKIAALSSHLKYQWLCTTTWHGTGAFVPARLVVCKSTQIALYSKGEWKPITQWVDSLHSVFKDKKYHPWQKPLHEIKTLLSYFSRPGDLVVDPCAGSFTTAVACLHTGRRCIACDAEEQSVRAGQARLKEELAAEPVCLPLQEPSPIEDADGVSGHAVTQAG